MPLHSRDPVGCFAITFHAFRGRSWWAVSSIMFPCAESAAHHFLAIPCQMTERLAFVSPLPHNLVCFNTANVFVSEQRAIIYRPFHSLSGVEPDSERCRTRFQAVRVGQEENPLIANSFPSMILVILSVLSSVNVTSFVGVRVTPTPFCPKTGRPHSEYPNSFSFYPECYLSLQRQTTLIPVREKP